VWAEGHPCGRRLGPAGSLLPAHKRLAESFDELGIRLGHPAGVGRLDVATTLGFDEGCDGQSFLTGVAGLDLPGMKPVIWGRPVETVAFVPRRGRSLTARVYDHGRHRGIAEPGRLIRLEAQFRYLKGRRVPVDEIDSAFLRTRFHTRFAPLCEAAKGVRVGGAPALSRELCRRVRDRAMTAREAERIAGFVLLDGAYGDGLHPPRTASSRTAELRRHGLITPGECFGDIDLDVGQVLDAALFSDAWEDTT
jgi:hypothetical protein